MLKGIKDSSNLNPIKPKYKNLEFAKDLWYFFKPFKSQVLFYTFLLVLAFSLDLLPIIIIAKMIDLFMVKSPDISKFYIYLGIILAIGIFTTILRLRTKYLLGNVSYEAQRKAKVESFEKIMQSDLIWHDKENTGNRMQRVLEGGASIANFTDFYLNKGIDMVVKMVGIVTIFLFFSLKYAFLALAFMLCYLYFEFKLNKRIAQKTFESKVAAEVSTGKAFEFSSNISTIKSLGMELTSNKQIASFEEKTLEARKSKSSASNMKWIIIQLVSTFFFALFLFLVGKDVIWGVLTVGSIVIYVQYVYKLQEVLNTVSNQVSTLTDVKYGVYRMMEIHKSIPEINEENSTNLGIWNQITINNLKFKYKDEDVLDGFSLKIKKGEKIGLVGKSGSGKSTLFKLLLKLYLPQQGNIYFDKKPIREIRRSSLTKKISIVPQETELFNMNIKENITISEPFKIDYSKYRKALLISCIGEVISKLKDKDLTLIGEKGIRLSGGERQRLGIARAIYKDGEIIILDEATSNLDYETEKKIQEALSKELKNKTLIFAAHRLSTLRNMDRIIVISKGKITEEGSFYELIKQRGEFYNLWRKQIKFKEKIQRG